MGNGRQDADQRLTREQLAAVKAELGTLKDFELESHYLAFHNACRSVRKLPSPAAIQKLVQAWKELRKRQKQILR